MRDKISAGVATEIVTPDLGCQLAGFDARKGVAEAVHDDLHATSLVLDDGNTATVLVSIEVLGVSREFADAVRAEIAHTTGIPPRNVVLSATHTHCAPVTFNHFFNQGQALDQAYLDRLASGIVQSAVRAAGSRRPASLRTGSAQVNGVAVNRRTSDGLPIDETAGVLTVHDDGTIQALAIFYPCHTTTLGPNTLEVTADFPYYTIAKLKGSLGSGTEVLYFNGTEGDLSVGHKSDLSAVGVIAPNRTFERAAELGYRLADCVTKALPSLAAEATRLAVENSVVELPLKTYAPLAEMRRRREDAGRAMQEATATNLIGAKQTSLFSRIEEYYASLLEGASGRRSLPAELTAARIGNTAILSFPGEVFVEIGLAIRERSPFANTWFAGLANDYIGYVPTADASAALGYEVVASRVIPEAARVLTDAALGLLNRLEQAA